MNRITERLFERLQKEVEKNPAQWFGWHNLDKLNPRPVRSAGGDESDELGEGSGNSPKSHTERG